MSYYICDIQMIIVQLYVLNIYNLVFYKFQIVLYKKYVIINTIIHYKTHEHTTRENINNKYCYNMLQHLKGNYPQFQHYRSK